MPSEEEQRTELLEPKPEQGKVEEIQEPPEKLPGISAKFKVTTPQGDVELDASDISIVSGKEVVQQDPGLVTQSKQAEFQGFEEKKEEPAPSPEPIEQQPILEGQERANELRGKYQELNLAQYLNLPLYQVPNLPHEIVEKAKTEGMNTIKLFVGELYRRDLARIYHRSEPFLDSYDPIFDPLGRFLEQKEQEAVNGLGLSGRERGKVVGKVPTQVLFNAGHYRGGLKFRDRDLVNIFNNFRRNLPAPQDVGTLAIWTEQELRQVKDIGPSRLRKIEEFLASEGLSPAKG